MNDYHYLLGCLYVARAQGWNIAQGVYVDKETHECCAIGAVIIAEGGVPKPMKPWATGVIDKIESRPMMHDVALGFDYVLEVGQMKSDTPGALFCDGPNSFALGVEMLKAAKRRGWLLA